jgi:hypothetical protein
MSVSNAAPARANMSPSPEVSTTTLARIAWRPALLSKITPVAVPSSTSGRAAQAWNTIRTPARSSISWLLSFIRSGSSVGAHWTMPWNAVVRFCQ